MSQYFQCFFFSFPLSSSAHHLEVGRATEVINNNLEKQQLHQWQGLAQKLMTAALEFYTACNNNVFCHIQTLPRCLSDLLLMANVPRILMEFFLKLFQALKIDLIFDKMVTEVSD